MARFAEMKPTHAGVRVTSGCARIGSVQSDGAGEASHASLRAQRECRDRQGNGAVRVRRVQMVDNNPLMLSTFLPSVQNTVSLE